MALTIGRKRFKPMRNTIDPKKRYVAKSFLSKRSSLTEKSHPLIKASLEILKIKKLGNSR